MSFSAFMCSLAFQKAVSFLGFWTSFFRGFKGWRAEVPFARTGEEARILSLVRSRLERYGLPLSTMRGDGFLLQGLLFKGFCRFSGAPQKALSSPYNTV